MAIIFLDPTPFVHYLNTSGNVIITANNRIRTHLLRALALKASPSSVLVNPLIYTLAQYIDQQSQEFEAVIGKPLNVVSANQRRYLWQSIIENSEMGQGLLQAKPLAKQADNAFKYLEQWNIPLKSLTQDDFSLHENTRQLLKWIDCFHELLNKHGLITQEDATRQLIDAMARQEISTQREVLLIGFDDIPPLSQIFLSRAFEKVETYTSNKPLAQSITRLTLESQEQEIYQAALWANNKLVQSPLARIGIIVPNLGQCRDQVEKVFTRVFEPQRLHPSSPRATPPFNFSAGVPLGSTPIIASAQTLLKFEQHTLPLDELCNLLNSPFWGGASSYVINGFIERLRKLERPALSAADIRHHFEKHLAFINANVPESIEPAEEWRTIFNRSANAVTLITKKSSIAYWVEVAHHLLSQFNWPGYRTLDSVEHQQVAQWYQLLESLIELDDILEPISWSEFVSELVLTARSTPFQAQTPLSPIQILGALESSTLEFDYCWVIGLHNRQWPAAPSPNPFLPVDLQRENQMPHASAERELLFAQSLTTHYLSCATEVILSSPNQLDDQELQPSALIKDIALSDVKSIFSSRQESDMQLHIHQLLQQFTLETFVDQKGPVLSPQEKIRGGASLLKEQAACPFNAFAKYRLGAENPAQPVAGISYRDRGNLLHNTLASIWSQLKNQAALLQLSKDELHQLINTCLQPQINKLAAERGLTNLPLYLDVETIRTQKLLIEWLEIEKTRAPFEVISIEEPIQIEFEGIALNLRLDRIDRLENGDLLLIDYKTGSPNIKDWQGDRPKDPQLPLYALTTTPPPTAISFARISAKGSEFIGIGKAFGQPITLKQPEDWALEISQWQTALSQLAQEFQCGDARVVFSSDEAKRHAVDLLPLNRHLA